MAGTGQKPGENVFEFSRRVEEARSGLPSGGRDEPSDGPLRKDLPSELAIALLPAPQFAQEMILQWLNRVANPCRVTILDQPAASAAGDEGDGPYDLIVVCHCLHQAGAEHMLAAVRGVRAKWQDVPVVVVSDNEDNQLVVEALRSGVNGYIPTRLPVPVAIAAVKLVLSGGTYSPPLLPTNAASAGDPAAQQPLRPLPTHIAAALKLSPRECQVLQLMQLGYSNRQIGGQLKISQNTVMVHVRHLMRKLGATNRTQAVFKARQLLDRLRDSPDDGDS